jgi:hypothetical protein
VGVDPYPRIPAHPTHGQGTVHKNIDGSVDTYLVVPNEDKGCLPSNASSPIMGAKVRRVMVTAGEAADEDHSVTRDVAATSTHRDRGRLPSNASSPIMGAKVHRVMVTAGEAGDEDHSVTRDVAATSTPPARVSSPIKGAKVRRMMPRPLSTTRDTHPAEPLWAEAPSEGLRESLQCVVSLLLPDPVPTELKPLNHDNVAQAVRDSRQMLGTDIVYDEEFYRTREIPDIERCDFEANDRALETEDIETILERVIRTKKLQGMQPDELREFFAGASQIERAIEILSEGERPFMTPEFQCNGGKECTPGATYRDKRRLCNMAIRKLAQTGRVILFSRDALERAKQMQKLHKSPLIWAEKADAEEGRTCLHLSKSSKSFPSHNSCVDDGACDAHYPPRQLPLLPDIAEMACRQRDANPGKQIAGATVDVKSAYHQFPKSVEAALLTATMVQIPDKTKAKGMIELIAVYGYGIFGQKKAGNVYGVLGGVIHEKHNMCQSEERSKDYVDDGILISPDDEMDDSLREYIGAVVALFGAEGVNMKKVNRWRDKLVAIGWEFCFNTWRVQPKSRGLAKMMVLLFDTIPPGTRLVQHRDIERLQGLLTWYASGIPAGKSFISSLFRCGETSRGKLTLSNEAQQDLDWWRSLVWVAYHVPQILGADIDSVRRNPIPTRFLRTDASSEVGGGAVASLTMGGEAIELGGAQIRWTRAELEVFREMNISINVLEYFTAMFYIMVWASEFEGRVIHVECDNTAAVSWLMKSRANGGNVVANLLAKIFTLFLLRHCITLICTHLAGEKNVVADFHSRDLSLCPQEADEGVVDGQLWRNSSRRDACRNLLFYIVTKPERMHGRELVRALTVLGMGHGRSTAE